MSLTWDLRCSDGATAYAVADATIDTAYVAAANVTITCAGTTVTTDCLAAAAEAPSSAACIAAASATASAVVVAARDGRLQPRDAQISSRLRQRRLPKARAKAKLVSCWLLTSRLSRRSRRADRERKRQVRRAEGLSGTKVDKLQTRAQPPATERPPSPRTCCRAGQGADPVLGLGDCPC